MTYGKSPHKEPRFAATLAPEPREYRSGESVCRSDIKP
jgi:hypothetical protein